MEADVKNMGNSWGQLEKLAQDRNAWRTLVDGLCPRRGNRRKALEKENYKPHGSAWTADRSGLTGVVVAIEEDITGAVLSRDHRPTVPSQIPILQDVQRPPPYAPPMEEKSGQPPASDAVPVMSAPVLGHPVPRSMPPPYETNPGYLPPHVPGEGPMPMPMPMPHPHMGYYAPPPGHFAQPIPGQYPPGPSHYPSHTATVLAPPGGATTVTVLQGEMFQAIPVQTVCPHCQQAILTRISHDLGLMNTLFCLFCCVVGCDLGCCLIPCLIDDLKDVTHTCPNCNGYIYTYKRMC
ncbi:hypothetical protein AAFF_G00212710 [Aldrovandia affinis]|uniref:Cell death-inducing p53-target protein 1 n=1 Tax=Aldrovandia affinis TaxID=143900 RepID=A0AAD7W515_9TELE|nr:hypothetical protein AAFF_G00212710 [Aldrovandia affinis]